MCGRLLERKGVGIRPDDENELSDTVRTPESPAKKTDITDQAARESGDGDGE